MNFKIKTVSYLLVMLLSAQLVFADDPHTIKIKTSAICGMCKRKIEKNLVFEKGIESANLDLTSKILTVSYDPKKISSEKIKKAVANTGYDADEVDANPEAYEKLSSCCKKTAAAHH